MHDFKFETMWTRIRQDIDYDLIYIFLIHIVYKNLRSKVNWEGYQMLIHIENYEEFA